ncbi:MAG: hypothetical protein B5M56_01710 [Desulfococcus sp. 4484_241]|nr:MAG: hypothetical protein B5M56_01710 [Desulfococcus sp. 4484_241]
MTCKSIQVKKCFHAQNPQTGFDKVFLGATAGKKIHHVPPRMRPRKYPALLPGFGLSQPLLFFTIPLERSKTDML